MTTASRELERSLASDWGIVAGMDEVGRGALAGPVAVGVAGLFMETHPDPDHALSDGPNAWPLGKMPLLLEQLMALDNVAKSI